MRLRLRPWDRSSMNWFIMVWECMGIRGLEWWRNGLVEKFFRNGAGMVQFWCAGRIISNFELCLASRVRLAGALARPSRLRRGKIIRGKAILQIEIQNSEVRSKRGRFTYRYSF